MNQDKIHFRAFLLLCRQNGITVWADRHLMKTKQTSGHWNGFDHISIYRETIKSDQVGILPGHSSEKKIEEFIADSPNIKWEMAILLHEYGHWCHKHPHLNQVDSVTSYKQEVEAWEKGEEIGRSLGMQDFAVFYAEREKALHGYRVGLRLEPASQE